MLEPAYVAEVGDLLTASGQPRAGAQEHARARAAEAKNSHPPEADPR